MRLGKAARLLRRSEFLAVQEHGRSLYARELVVLARDAGRAGPRLGITVSGRIANAVVRNRIKRWVREAFRSMAAELPPVDLVVVARPGAGRAGAAGARAALAAARDRLAAREASP